MRPRPPTRGVLRTTTCIGYSLFFNEAACVKKESEAWCLIHVCQDRAGLVHDWCSGPFACFEHLVTKAMSHNVSHVRKIWTVWIILTQNLDATHEKST